MLLLLGVPALTGAADPQPNVEATQNFLDIYYPQNGKKVPPEQRFTVGSFTLVNLNDTTGKGKPDLDNNDLLVASADLKKDANKDDTTIQIDPNKVKDFP